MDDSHMLERWRHRREHAPIQIVDLPARHLGSYLECLEDWSPEQEPRWVEAQPVEVRTSGRVEVTAFQNGWCPAANLVFERARRASEEPGSEVQFTTIDTSDRDTMLRCGRSDEVLVDGRPLQRSAPFSYKTVKRKIARQLRTQRRRP